MPRASATVVRSAGGPGRDPADVRSGVTVATLLAVCVVRALRPDAGTVGVTAIDKVPVDGPVRIGPYGVYADVQADRKHHGGLEKALYAYSQADADFWAAQLGRDLPPGWFGENLRIDGLDLSAARIGERWRIGDAVEVEVTMPRTPCQTFARWVAAFEPTAERGWVKRFSAERRLGPYLRVVQGGRVSAGDAVSVTHVPEGAPGLYDAYVDPA